jgi:acyl-coenzyme A synthetase/AMP-(fatty) acid ligase
LRAGIEFYGLNEQDTLAFNAPLTFDVAVWQALTMACVGGRVHIIDEDTNHDSLAFVRCIAAEHITIVEIVPQVLRAILDMWDLDETTVGLVSGLRWLIVHGEELSPDLVDRWFARHPHIPMANAYGPAECSDDVSISVIKAPSDLRRNRAPIGRPLRNVRAYVLDADLRLLPAGVAGELYVAGAGLARGYAGSASGTAQRFMADPFAGSGERMYRTGDLACWNSDGELEFCGRVDHQVKIRGFRVEPGEVQAVLAEDPRISQVAVCAQADRQGQLQLVAFVVPSERADLDLGDVRLRTTRLLPSHMVPAFFVPLAELPVTANGKLNRRALPLPDLPAAPRKLPRTPQEEALCGLFAQVLGVPAVGTDDDFFELGGHSMLVMQLLNRIRASMDMNVPVRVVFETPTVAGIVQSTGRATGSRLGGLRTWAKNRVGEHASGSPEHSSSGKA